MKLGLVVAVSLVAARVASADPGYPETLVDRPLNLLPGMTSVDISEQLSSTTKQTFGHQTPDVAVFHGFGPLEVGAELGEFAVLHLSLSTHTIPESVEIFGLTGVPQKDDSLHVAQGAVAGHRFHLVPGALAIAGNVGVTASENRIRDAMNMLEWTQVLATYASARVELQVLPQQLAVFAGLAVDVPLANWGGPEFVRSLGAGGGVIVTLGTWDIYVNSGVTDLTDHRLPYLSGGFVKRWGS